jgi:hypothetical protein
LQSSDAVNLQVRFRDNGANARVIVHLRQYNLNTGVITTPLTLDSNAFPAAASSQVQRVNSTCFAGNFFDFQNNAYFIEAQLIKSAAGGDPVLAIIRIGTLVC